MMEVGRDNELLNTGHARCNDLVLKPSDVWYLWCYKLQDPLVFGILTGCVDALAEAM
jgi:hypothetical protein